MGLLDIKNIRTDGGTQHRARPYADVIDEYAEHYRDNKKMPPLDIMFDGKYNWLWNGFHRMAAAIKAGKRTINVEIVRGSQHDAFKKSLGANQDNGIRRSNDDKRRAVEAAFQDDEVSTMTNREIADLCGVSHTYVNGLRPPAKATASGNVSTPDEKIGAEKSGTHEGNGADSGGQVKVAASVPENGKRERHALPVEAANGHAETPVAKAEPKPQKGVIGSLEVITRERDELRERLTEMAQQLEEVMAENAELLAAVELNDSAKAMQQSNKALRKELTEKEDRMAGLMNEKASAIAHAKSWQKKAQTNGHARH